MKAFIVTKFLKISFAKDLLFLQMFKSELDWTVETTARTYRNCFALHAHVRALKLPDLQSEGNLPKNECTTKTK